MSSNSKTDPDVRQIRAILARWDAIAYAQLTAEAARLSDLVDELRDDASRADADAEFWNRSFHDLEEQLEERGGALGITPDCRFVAIDQPAGSPIHDSTFPGQPSGCASTTN
jgi:hypothetical protein